LESLGAQGARKHFDEIETWAQFHPRSSYSFYTRRSPMHKKRQSSQQCLLALLGPTSVKAARQMLVKLTPVDSQLRHLCTSTQYTYIAVLHLFIRDH
jgi:hypothetical protein